MNPAGAILRNWPLAVFTAGVVLVIMVMMGLSWLLGQRHQEKATLIPYESGILPTGTARMRFPVRFYLVAVVFVIFDLEALFVITWALVLREAGWRGYGAMLLFIIVLLIALFYLYRQGLFDLVGSGLPGRKAGEKKDGPAA